MDWNGNDNGVIHQYPGGGSTYADAVIPETGTVQLLLGEGVLDGLGPAGTASTDWLKYIYLDNTAIENADGTKNFKGIALALVAGTTTQASVKGITGTESETGVNVQVAAASPVTRSISGNPSAVRVRISIPALKQVDSNSGKASGYAVTVKIERQNASYNGGAWEVVTLENGGTISGGPYSTKYTRSFRIDTPVSGTWQIRVTRVSPDDADAWHLSQTWWEAYTSIIDARLRYPRSAVLSLRVNAKQFQQVPQISVLARMNQIQVPANYDPIARTYATTGLGTSGGLWDGTFKTAWSDSPPWRFFDLASNTTYGAGTFLSVSGLDKWTLYSIAQWCDTLVPNGKGGTEPRMACNLYLQGQENAIKALGQLASIFWGVIYYASGLVVPVADTDSSPVALFTNANVEDGRFTYEGTARQARHTSAIVKFINPELGWTTDSAVYEANADSALIAALGYDPVARYGYNVLDLQGIGCTSQGQALRLAKQAVLTELMAPEAVSFTSGLMGSTVKPGDVAQISDQFRAGQFPFGGMTAAGSTATVIQLDRPVTLGAGTYTLKITTNAGVESKTVTTGAGTVTALTVASAFSAAPGAGITWLLQSPTFASRWRVLSVAKGDGLKYSVTALYHDPQKYALLGLAAGDVIPRPTVTNTTPAPAGLAVTNSVRILNDRQVQTLSASWTLDGASTYTAQARRDSGPWTDMVITGATAILDGIQPGVWDVRVCGNWRPAGISPWATATATVNASSTQPGWVATAQAAADAAALAASNAQTAANTANNALANIASDSILSPGEKPAVVLDYTAIAAEQSGIDAQATAYSITTEKTAYDNAVGELTTYLGTLTGWNTIPGSDVAIVGTTFRSKFADVYATRQALLNAIYAKAKTIADTAQTGVNNINDPDTLTPGEKPEFIQDYSVLTGENAGLVSQAGTYGVSLTAYNAAYTALITTYLPTLTSPYAWNSLVGNTTLGAGNRVALWNAKWAALRSAANDLRGAIASGVFTSATAQAAMDALTKANAAQLASQPHQVAWAYASKPALPSALYPAGYYAITTDSRTVQVNAAGTAWTDVLVAATGLFGKVFASQVVIGGVGTKLNLDPAFEDPNFWVATAGTFAIVTDSSTPFGRNTLYGIHPEIRSNDSISIDTNKSYRLSGWLDRDSAASGTFNLGIELLDSAGAHINGPAGTYHYLVSLLSGVVPANTWTRFSGTIGPAGSGCDLTFPSNAKTARMIALLNLGGTVGNGYLSGLMLEEIIQGELIVKGGITADKLAADLALVNVIRSNNYVAGYSGAAPVGFKFSGTTFTTTYKDGTTDAACQLEMGGSGNFDGYKVATVNSRLWGSISKFTTPGTHYWTAPPGVTQVEVTRTGAGGGGSGGDATHNGAGGGAGACCRTIYTVTPGNTYTVVVGAKGTGGSPGVAGTDGGASSFAGDTSYGGTGGTVTVSGDNFVGGTGAFIGPSGISGSNTPAGTSASVSAFFLSTFVPGAGGGSGESRGGVADGSSLDSLLADAGGSGGGSAMGHGGAMSYTSGNSAAPTNYGAGGGGGHKGYAGGNGADGYVSVVY